MSVEQHKNGLALFTGSLVDYAKSFISEEIRKVVGAPQNDESDKSNLLHLGTGFVFKPHVSVAAGKAVFSLETSFGGASQTVPIATVDYEALIPELDKVLEQFVIVVNLIVHNFLAPMAQIPIPAALELPLKEVTEAANEAVTAAQSAETLLGELTGKPEATAVPAKEPTAAAASKDSTTSSAKGKSKKVTGTPAAATEAVPATDTSATAVADTAAPASAATEAPAETAAAADPKPAEVPGNADASAGTDTSAPVTTEAPAQ